MAFETVLGNETVKELLRHTLASGRIGHAYIIEGVRGMGKHTVAEAFAGAILGTANPKSHPDYAEVTNQRYEPSKKQTQVLVDTVRQMKQEVYIRPYAGERKVYVIPGADTMQAPAQNALLKVLEEPPEYCTILLLAENANGFLPTIRSRALLLRLAPVPRAEIVRYLTEQRAVSLQRAEQAVALCGGAVGKAIDLLADEASAKLREETLEKVLALAEGSHRDLYDLVRFLKQNKGEIALIMETLLVFGREVMHCKLSGAASSDAIRSFCGKIPRQSAAQFSAITIKYQQMLEQNVNYPIAVLCMATEYWEEIHDRNYRR